MTEIKRLESLLHYLHTQRHNLNQCMDEDAARLECLWERIHRYEAELEEARLLAGITR